MQHLSDEILARLVDELPDEREAFHLGGCATCRSELEALREQTVQLAELPEMGPPAAQWPALEERLAAEDLLRLTPRRGRIRLGPAWRVAAALALFVSGAAAGYLTRPPGAAVAPRVAARPPATPEEAVERLRRLEAEYTAAVARYAELTGTDRAVDPVSRLAALEGIVLTTRAALQESPADPVINGYHLAALGQRDAILKRIADVPASADTTNQEWF